MAERLSRFLARAGVAARRKAEQIIISGRVSVNGDRITDPFHRVTLDADLVTIDGRQITELTTHTYIALHKPPGYISDLADPRGRRLARQLIPLRESLFPVGRLDYNSEGLMIFTNDGDFAEAIMHPRNEVEKEYLVKLVGRLTPQDTDRMQKGMHVEGNLLRVKSVVPFRDSPRNTWYRMVVTEGKNRMLRKLGRALSHPVLKLKRIRIDGITLGGLKPGQYRHLDPAELRRCQGLSRGQAIV